MVFQNALELALRPPPTTLKPRFMTISLFRWNSCGLSKCL